jgi:UMF1 family MFS transporter
MISKARFRELLPLISWCVYGWASDTFPILITTFVFSTYFISHVAADKISGTIQWANATALAGIIIAFAGPIFGAIADQDGQHKRWLGFFTFCCIVSTAFLWFVCPSPLCIGSALALFVIGSVSLEITHIFYNSFLPMLVTPKFMGRVSGVGWGLGYFGGIVALAAVLMFSVLHKPGWLDSSSLEEIRIVGPFSALWFALFCLPLFLFVSDTPNNKQSLTKNILYGLRHIKRTLTMLVNEKNILWFLLARMIYTDGLNTLFAFGGIFAVGTFNFSFTDILIFGITLNVMAGVGAIGLAWFDDHLGSKPTILMSLVCLTLIGTVLVFTQTSFWFWVTASMLAIFVGPVQSASRSLMAHLTPPNKTSELFGLYALSGRVTSFIGPWLLGYVTYYFQSQRAGMATILLFFVIGGIMLTQVQIAKSLGRR